MGHSKLNDLDYIFYDSQWTVIIDSLLKFIPESDPFNLRQLSIGKDIKLFDDFNTWLYDNEDQYRYLTQALIINDIVVPSDNSYVKLTDKGRSLKFAGSWRQYQINLHNEKRASFWRTWKDANWLPLAALGFFITTIFSIVSPLLVSLIQQGSEKRPNNTIQLKIDLVLPDSTVLLKYDSTLNIHSQ